MKASNKPKSFSSSPGIEMTSLQQRNLKPLGIFKSKLSVLIGLKSKYRTMKKNKHDIHKRGILRVRYSAISVHMWILGLGYEDYITSLKFKSGENLSNPKSEVSQFPDVLNRGLNSSYFEEKGFDFQRKKNQEIKNIPTNYYNKPSLMYEIISYKPDFETKTKLPVRITITITKQFEGGVENWVRYEKRVDRIHNKKPCMFSMKWATQNWIPEDQAYPILNEHGLKYLESLNNNDKLNLMDFFDIPIVLADLLVYLKNNDKLNVINKDDIKKLDNIFIIRIKFFQIFNILDSIKVFKSLSNEVKLSLINSINEDNRKIRLGLSNRNKERRLNNLNDNNRIKLLSFLNHTTETDVINFFDDLDDSNKLKLFDILDNTKKSMLIYLYGIKNNKLSWSNSLFSDSVNVTGTYFINALKQIDMNSQDFIIRLNEKIKILNSFVHDNKYKYEIDSLISDQNENAKTEFINGCKFIINNLLISSYLHSELLMKPRLSRQTVRSFLSVVGNKFYHNVVKPKSDTLRLPSTKSQIRFSKRHTDTDIDKFNTHGSKEKKIVHVNFQLSSLLSNSSIAYDDEIDVLSQCLKSNCLWVQDSKLRRHRERLLRVRFHPSIEKLRPEEFTYLNIFGYLPHKSSLNFRNGRGMNFDINNLHDSYSVATNPFEVDRNYIRQVSIYPSKRSSNELKTWYRGSLVLIVNATGNYLGKNKFDLLQNLIVDKMGANFIYLNLKDPSQVFVELNNKPILKTKYCITYNVLEYKSVAISKPNFNFYKRSLN
jgi:hypothetical protein